MFRHFLCKSVTVKRFEHNLSYAFGASNEPLVSQTISQIFDRNAIECPERVAIVSQHQGISKTYHQFNNDINKLAIVLTRLGCKRGDRIGIWAPNCYEWIVTQIATAKIGTILVNINPAYRLNELNYCLNLVDCHTIISAQRVRTSNYYEMLQNLIPSLKGINTTQKIEDQKFPLLKNIIMVNHPQEPAPSNFLRFNDLMNLAPNEAIITENEFDDAINIQFTSGTTGSPKGATLSHHNVVNNAQFAMKRMFKDITDPQVICLQVPLYHTFGCVIGTLLGGFSKSTIVMPSESFNAIESIKAIHNYKVCITDYRIGDVRVIILQIPNTICSMIYGTPTMYVDILNSPEPISKYNTKSLKRGVMSGAYCPPELMKQFMRVIPYGATELSPIITLTSIEDSEKHRFDSVGKPLDHTEIKIVDYETGKIKPIGQPGEVLSRGYSTFIGYWNQPEKTKESLNQTRWYRTGDIAIMDKDGYLTISGRIKEMIIRGGENIFPKEIENFLLTNQAIADAHVVGVPNKRMGEEICAYIRLKNQHQLTENDIKEFCKNNISHFKIPRFIEFVDDYPRTVTGKVQKYILKEIASQKYESQ